MTKKILFLPILAMSLCQMTFARAHDHLQGPAISLGFGTCYGGGIGAELEYQFRKPLGLYTVTPFVGSGAARSAGQWLKGVDLGCLFEFGVAHRVFGAFSYGTLREWHEVSGPEPHTARAMEVGGAFHLGYKDILPFGLYWIVSANLGIIDSSPGLKRQGTGQPWLSVGIGYKY